MDTGIVLSLQNTTLAEKLNTVSCCYSVLSVTRKGHLKRVRLSSDGGHFDVPLSACVAKGDTVVAEEGRLSVVCRYGEKVVFFPCYDETEIVHFGNSEVLLRIKEITENDEFQATQELVSMHYRTRNVYGRVSRLIISSHELLFPKVLGYIELATPIYMSRPRDSILDTSFSCGEICWECWNKESRSQYINLIVRISRCVVHPEFRGLGLGQMLVRHVSRFASTRWQVAQTKPLFLEITADMLKFVPFVKGAGMVYVGETDGNLGQIYNNVEYLLRNRHRIQSGEIMRDTEGTGSGVIRLQRLRLKRVVEIMEQEGLTPDSLLKHLRRASQKQSVKDFAVLHEIIKFPKQTYMQGLTQYADMFIRERATRAVGLHEGTGTNFVFPITSPIRLRHLSVSYHSSVRLTENSYAVQQAFGVSPRRVSTVVLHDLVADIKPGTITLVLGHSGVGKTTLIELLAKRKSKCVVEGGIEFPDGYCPGFIEQIKSNKSLVEVFANRQGVVESLRIMGMVGLSDAHVYLKRFGELSRGQQFRAMLAYLIASNSNVWLIDEFCATLDSVSAHTVANNLQKVARKLGATVIVAASHCQHFLHSLKPDAVIQIITSHQYSIWVGDEFSKLVKESRIPY